MDSAFNRFESRYIIQFRIPCKNLSMKEGMSRLRTSTIFRMLSQTHSMTSTSDSQNQKSHIAVEKAFSSSGKGKWRTYMQHIFCQLVDWWFGLLWRFGVACLLYTSVNANDKPPAKIALWRVTVFCLYHG